MIIDISFTSFNQRDNVQGWIYTPSCKPRGIIQVIHGFCEHSRRYLHMIVSFMDAGFIVAADDHVGHGKTAEVNDTWFDWGEYGYETLTEDEHKLTQIVKEKYPDIPYFLFGHSMGSFITRDYMTKYGNELDGAILCGTCGVFDLSDEEIQTIKNDCDAGLGKVADPKNNELFVGRMCNRIPEEVKYGNEWICDDEYVLLDNINDPYNGPGKLTTNRSLYDFSQLIQAITGQGWAEKVPENIPILNIAGDCDPVGNYGEGVYQVTNWLINTGHKVTTKLYNGYRHEIHNYNDLKFEMELDMQMFLDNILEPETI